MGYACFRMKESDGTRVKASGSRSRRRSREKGVKDE
jgi:hypothetical protein